MKECVRLRNIVLRAKAEASFLFPGEKPTRVKGIGLEYEDFREYSFGDDPRFIDWRLTARSLTPSGDYRLMVKEFRVEKKREVVLVYDLTSSMEFKEKYLTSLYVATILAETARKLEDTITLVTFNGKIETYPRKSPSHVPYILLRKSCIEKPSGDLDLYSVYTTLCKLATRKPVFVITDYANNVKGYMDIAKTFKTVFYLVTSKGELPTKLNGLTFLLDIETEKGETVNLKKFYDEVMKHVTLIRGYLKQYSKFIEFKNLREAREKTFNIALNYVFTRQNI